MHLVDPLDLGLTLALKNGMIFGTCAPRDRRLDGILVLQKCHRAHAMILLALRVARHAIPRSGICSVFVTSPSGSDLAALSKLSGLQDDARWTDT